MTTAPLTKAERHVRNWIVVCGALCAFAFLLPQPRWVGSNLLEVEWCWFWELDLAGSPFQFGYLAPVVGVALCFSALKMTHATARMLLLIPVSAIGVFWTLMQVASMETYPTGDYLQASLWFWLEIFCVGLVPVMAHRMRTRVDSRAPRWLLGGAIAALALMLLRASRENFFESPLHSVWATVVLATVAYLVLAMYTAIRQDRRRAEWISLASRVALFASPVVMAAVGLQIDRAEAAEFAEIGAPATVPVVATLVVGVWMHAIRAAQYLAAALVLLLWFQRSDLREADDPEVFE